MKLISTNIFLIFLLFVVQLSGCSLSPQSASLENQSTNSVSKSPTIVNKPANIAEENFAKEWKSKYETTVAELKRNQVLWQESKVLNYDFVASKSAGGNTNSWNRLPVLIKIREGQKTSIEKVEKDKDYVIYSRTDGFEDFDTIDKLFNYLWQELNDGKMIAFKYDKKLGYPKEGAILDSNEIHGYRNIIIEKFEAK